MMGSEGDEFGLKEKDEPIMIQHKWLFTSSTSSTAQLCPLWANAQHVMKRNISDSLGGVVSISPSDDKKNSLVYGRGFQSMLDGIDDDDCLDETGQISEKKRRLSVDQVKALEKSFEVENKLEPERKVKLAQDLGLQPRQVAVWFQNRRARWKTKQLERDYGNLKASYDSLKLTFESLQHDNEALLAELNKLKSKQGEENTESTRTLSVKEEEIIKESENEISPTLLMGSENKDQKQVAYNKGNSSGVEACRYGDMRDGSSDSDSSAILNEDNTGVFQLMMAASSSPSTSSLRFSCSSPSSINGFQSANAHKEESYHPHQYIKMEEHNFFGSEEPCNFFAEEQAPSLHWYCPDQWN